MTSRDPSHRPTWLVTFAKTANDATIATFDCEISKLARYVSPKIGELQIQIPVPNATIGKEAARIFGGSGKTSMYVYRDNEIWWGGFFDEATVDSAGEYPVISVTGSTFEIYPDRREARVDKSLTMDQVEMANWLWDYMQGVKGGNILVDTPAQPASGRTRTMSWKRSDTKTVGSILKEVSNRADGFEWMIECYVDSSGHRRRKLVTGYPHIGRPSDGATLTFPGDIITYSILDTAMDGATSFQARGKAPDPIGTPATGSRGVYDPVTKKTTIVGGGGAKPSVKQDPIMSGIVTNDDLLNKGYTLTDATVDRPTVTKVETLNDWADLALAMRSGPMTLPDITCRIDSFMPSILGASVNLRINDYLWPMSPTGAPGYQVNVRVIGYEIDPGEFGADDVVKLIFENPRDTDNFKRSPD